MSTSKGKKDSNSSTSDKQTSFKLTDIPSYVMSYLRDVMDLDKGVNANTSIIEIRKKSTMAGANAWMLMCSIMIASIGLSQNSQAVIIGAMLISPLMSPILGIGLSIGINDMETLRNSLTHFGIAIIIALVTSTIYFEFTPFDSITHEIESRTRPTFLDILIAIFGGIAGIISVVRKDLSTTLPGVAIATALMPPLCVAGYGISHGIWDMASKAFYLFFLNSFFVALSTYVIVRFLRFPYKTFLNPRAKRRNILTILFFSLTLIIPSFLIFRSVLEDIKLENGMKKFRKTCLAENEIFLDEFDFQTKTDGSKILYLKVYGDKINNSNIDEYSSCLEELGIADVDISIINSSDVDIEDVQLLNQSIEDIEKRLEVSQEERVKKNQLVEYYSTNQIDTALFNQVISEIKVWSPDLLSISASPMHTSDFKNERYYVPTFILEWKEANDKDRKEKTERIRAFVKERLKLEEVRVYNFTAE